MAFCYNLMKACLYIHRVVEGGLPQQDWVHVLGFVSGQRLERGGGQKRPGLEGVRFGGGRVWEGAGREIHIGAHPVAACRYPRCSKQRNGHDFQPPGRACMMPVAAAIIDRGRPGDKGHR